jgi:hypothetical protein
MKKLTILLSMLVIMVLLAACGGTTEIVEAETNTQNNPQTETGAEDGAFDPENFAFEMPLQTSLIMGSFELEGTENEITSEQATELIPLWQVLKNLLDSDTAAAAEIDAVVNQISDTMTDDQIAYINNMVFDPQSMRTLMEELGLNQGFQRPEGAEGEEGSGPQRPEGMPEGMGPGSGPGGDGLTPEQIEAMQATREAGGGMGRGMGMNTELIDALIELLQSK